MLDDWRGSEYACVQTASNNVLCHQCKHLMGYFEFLYGSDIIFLLLIIPEKLHRQYLVKKPEEAETDVLFLVNTIQYPRTLKNSIHYSNKPVPPPFFYSDTNPLFGHVLIHLFDKNHVLVVTVEFIWFLLLNILSFNFVPTSAKGSQDSGEARWSVVVLTSHTSHTAFVLDVCCTVQSAHVPFSAAVCPPW